MVRISYTTAQLAEWSRVKAVLFVVLSVLFSIASISFAQTENDIKDYLDKVENGHADEVREMMPQIMTQYENTPELFYLQGRLEANGLEAVKLYQSVVDNFPKSDYADASLYRISQYYYATGLYQSADSEMARLKHDYPQSPYLTASNENIPAAQPTVDKAAASQVAASPKQDDEVRTEDNKSVAPVQPAVAPTKSAARTANFSLQVGAFSTSANASKQKAFFEKRGYHVEVSNRVMEKKGLFLVWVGAFRTSDDAKREAAQIKNKYKISSMVVER